VVMHAHLAKRAARADRDPRRATTSVVTID
jgi:hypothetical protein